MSLRHVIDLFSGCGGMSLGFQRFGQPERLSGVPLGLPRAATSVEGFRSVWANDFNREAAATYAHNFGEHVHFGPIEDYLEDAAMVPAADVVVGGPPCQGFSLLNKNKEGDERRQLWWHFLEIVDRSGARVLVMENVPQLLDGVEYEQIAARIRALGFRYLMAGVLNTANYGVPQTRRRAIVMASREAPISLPLPTHLPRPVWETLGAPGGLIPEHRPWRTVRDAIGNLPASPFGTEVGEDRSDPLALHFGRNPTDMSIERYKAVPPGGNRFDLLRNAPELTPACWVKKTSGGTDLFGRLWWDRPSVTIRTEFYKPEKGRYLHPEEHRPITHREAARIQSFPDDFQFRGSKIEVAKQIGNAVPPILAYHLAHEVALSLSGERTVQEMERRASLLPRFPLTTVREVWGG